MLDHFISLVGCYLRSDLMDFWFWPVVCLGLIYLTPSLIRSLFTWR